MENIPIGSCLRLLSQIEEEALDFFWIEIGNGRYPIIDLEGNLSFSILNQEGLLFIRNDFPASNYMQYELVFGGVFLPDTVEELLSRDKILILMVYNQNTGDFLLAKLDMDLKYMLDLPCGQYSFFAFIMDAETENFLDSTVYAIGIPCKENRNNPELEEFYHESQADVFEFIELNPINIGRGGPFYINLIMVDAREIPNCPMLFSELLEA